MESFTEQLSEDIQEILRAHGIPEKYFAHYSHHALGKLVPKLGIHFEELSAERTVATMPVAENTQPGGLLHGGASAALLETLGSFASNCAAPEGHVAVGTELSITHVRSATEGLVRAVCVAAKLGRSQCVHTVEIRDEAGKLISTGRMTNTIIPVRPQSSKEQVA